MTPKELLADADWSQQDSVLAKLVGCSREYVRQIRNLLGKPKAKFHKWPTRFPMTAKERPPSQSPDTRNPDAVALGKLGGRKGGKARAAKLTPKQRAQIAQKAARSRWAWPAAKWS